MSEGKSGLFDHQDVPKDLKKRGIFDQYEFFFNRYQQKYGSQTVIFLQVGGFYEIYGVENENTQIGNCKEVATLLHIELSRRNKEVKEINRKNHLMAGFPLASKDKYLDILVENNYTVVVVDQEGTSKDKTTATEKLPRRVSEIFSPGTCPSLGSHPDQVTKYLVQIHLEGIKKISRRSLLNALPDDTSSNNEGKSNNKLSYQSMIIGISTIDVTTGQSEVFEVSNRPDDHNFALDEIYRFLQSHPPKELVISSKNLHMSQDELSNYLDLNNQDHLKITIHHNQTPKEYYNLTYQKQFLAKVFPESTTKMISPIEYLNLERSQTALVSYLSLLQYTYEHNEILITKLERPRIWTTKRQLLLANNAISQLDLYNQRQGRLASVHNLLNWCSTNMGKRLFRERLLNPIIDINELNRRYQMIELFRSEDHWSKIENQLRGILDLDRIHRQMETRLISPNGIHLTRENYFQVEELLKQVQQLIVNNPTKLSDDQSSVKPQLKIDLKHLSENFRGYLEELDQIIDFSEVYKYVQVEKITDNIFCQGYDSKLDDYTKTIRLCRRVLDSLNRKLSNLINGQNNGTSVITLKNSESLGFYFAITANRFEILKAKLDEQPNGELCFKMGSPPNQKQYRISSNDFTTIRTTKDNKNHNLTCPLIKQISVQLTDATEKLQSRIVVVYNRFLDNLTGKYHQLFHDLSLSLAEVDFFKTCAQISYKYGYHRPEIYQEETRTGSFIVADNFRHPLVEMLNQNSYYVPHSIRIGEVPTQLLNSPSINNSDPASTNNSDPPSTKAPKLDGMLLYGLNSSGKSTLMKGIGINLVMAQAGMYVPADRFIYSPYHRLLTRILGNDNIFKGLSSFAVEMSELRGILARADQHSLVLGDEICHGTETISGVSIVGASIYRLARLKTQFIFATHLHQLNDLEEIQELTTQPSSFSTQESSATRTEEKPEYNLGIYHLHVNYNPVEHRLEYDRQLRPGPGNPIYGIEVARAMSLDDDLLSQANRIRQKLISNDQQILTNRRSRYNQNLLMDKCRVCHAPSEDTHHIKFQSKADKYGLIDNMNKNQEKNLVPLCKRCHRKIDTGELVIRGYLETSEGLKLDYTITPNQTAPTITQTANATQEKKSPKIRLKPRSRPIT